ncbi:MAG: hypothetical protein U9P14_08545, partial [Gemmatimonadota bacterium]|nr:hypothetical protein [Gemmatimonadota bacterium]
MDRRSPVIFLLTSLLVMWGAGCSKEEKNPHLENVLLEQLLVKAVATEEGFEKCGKQARKVLDDLRSGADFAETA